MTILRGLKRQRLADRHLMIGEASLVDAEGVMVDGEAQIKCFYAGHVEDSATALPQNITKVISPNHCETLGRVTIGCAGDMRANGYDEVRSIHESDHDTSPYRFIDANIGLPLDEGLCRAARKKEIDYFKNKGVWEMRSVNGARSKMERTPILVTWVERPTRATARRPTLGVD